MTTGERGQGGDVIDDAVREVGRTADQENCVGVDQTADGGDVDFVRGCWTCDQVDADFEVFAGFQEGCMCCVGDNPFAKSIVYLEVQAYTHTSLGDERRAPCMPFAVH